jgi:hypothetical protein
MTSITPFGNSQISKVFSNDPVQNDLSSGIASSYAIVGYKGKVWSVKHRGTETKLLRADGDGAQSSITCVIVATNRNLSKIYYAQGYTEGSSSAPDCFSNNGVTPEASAAHRQSPTCATCQRNVWGSKVSGVTGKPGKECQDNKRLAVVPLDDIQNEKYGGPMLLRVPAASLQELSAFGSLMTDAGYPHYAYATRISFDPGVAYPRFKFNAVRVLTDDEANMVKSMINAKSTARIIAETADVDTRVTMDSSETPKPVFEVAGTWTKPDSPQKTLNSASAQRVELDTPFQRQPVSSPPATEYLPTTQAPPAASIAPTVNTAPTQPIGSADPSITNTTITSKSSFEQELDSMMAKLLPAE